MKNHFRGVTCRQPQFDKLGILLVLAAAAVACLSSVAEAASLPTLDAYNVVWDSPSKDVSGTMPLGNGDISANVWVQDGDLLVLIGKTDAWDENSINCKLARVRVKMSPNPFAAGNPFRQELRLKQGDMLIKGGAPGSEVTMRLWVDANQPVIRVQTHSDQPVSQQVLLETWRNEKRVMTDTQVSDMFKNLYGPDPYPTILFPDTIVQGQKGRLLWYHHNIKPGNDPYEINLALQGMQDYQKVIPHPLLGRAFGASIQGPGFIAADAKTLNSTAAKKSHVFSVYPLTTLHTATPDQWKRKLDEMIAKVDSKPLPDTYDAHLAWWKAFWGRSEIHLAETKSANIPADGPSPAFTISRAYALCRFMNAAGGRGAQPIKYNGSIFTVGTPENPDFRQWGGPGFWFQNQRLVYWPMLAAGDFDLMEPWFRMYRDALPFAKMRCQKYFKHDGANFGETILFWGAEASSHYGWTPFGQRSIPNCECPFLTYYWQNNIENLRMMLDYFEHTGDMEFASHTLMPHADEVTKFYDLHYKRDESGKIRFDPAASLETWHTAVNPLPEIAGLGTQLPRLLGLPDGLTTGAQRTRWHRILKDLPPLPKGTKEGLPVILPAETFSREANYENPELYSVFPYPVYGIGKPDYEIARNTYATRKFKNTHCWYQDQVQSALLGLVDETRQGMIARASASSHSTSRFPAFWNAFHDWVPDIDHGGNLQLALQLMLLQADPGPTCKIRLLPTWPKDWDVSFKLHAPGGFETSAEQVSGLIRNVSIKSTLGGSLRIAKPWPGYALKVLAKGSGSSVPVTETNGIHSFPTTAGESYLLSRGGAQADVVASNTTSDEANVTEVNQWGFDTTSHEVQGHTSVQNPFWGAYCLAQSFSTGVFGSINKLSSISVGTVGPVTASTVTAYLYETTTGASPDNNYWKVAATPAATATVVLSAAAGPATITFDFSSANLTLSDNRTYIFYLRPESGSAFTWAGNSTSSYAGGEAMGVFADANLGGGSGFWTGNLDSVLSTNVTGDRVFSVTTIASPNPGTLEIPLDVQDNGRVFEGIGALSAGASSRLLSDYPEPQRSEVLDFLFKPNFGASLPHLKVEIGGEVNSTCGTEPTHQRTRDDLNFHRGYEWWLMKEAKKRRPDILLDTLSWGAPGWIGNGKYFSRDMADYIVRFIKGAKSEHGLDIHYTGIWNERMYDAEWIKLLRRALNDNGLSHVKIVAADLHEGQGDIWQLAGKMKGDPELAAAIDVLGGHYPKFQTTDEAKASGKRLWSSEEGPWRGDWEGAKIIAAQLNRNYVQGKMTKTITWSLVSSYYDSLRLPDSGMMRAKEPWSGHYEVQPAVWVFAHHNQFAKPGWRYLDKACRMLPAGGSVVAMASPSGTDASLVIETMGATEPQTLVLTFDRSLSSRKWQAWKTNQTKWFIDAGGQSPIDGKLTLKLAPDSVYSFTTTTGQAKAGTQPPASQKFPMPYKDDFESYTENSTPRYFMDQEGTFEVVRRADGKGKALAQVLPAPGIRWDDRDEFYPFTVLGDSDAKDYLVSVDAEAGNGVTVALICRFGRLTHHEASTKVKGYRFEVTAGSGAWKLSKPDGTLAEGTSPFPANTWHNLQLEARGTTLICRINDTVVAQAKDSTHFEGLAGLAAGYAGARFDNFVLSEGNHAAR